MRVFGALGILLFCTYLSGQNLVIDRPDYTESPNLPAPRVLQIEAGVHTMHSIGNPNVNARLRLTASSELRCIASASEGIELGGKLATPGHRPHRYGLVAGVNLRQDLAKLIFAAEHDVGWGAAAWNLGGVYANGRTQPFATLGGAVVLSKRLQLVQEVVYLPSQWTRLQWNAGAIWHPVPEVALDFFAEPPWSKPFWTLHLGYSMAFKLPGTRPAAPRSLWSRRTPPAAIAEAGGFCGGFRAVPR